MAETMFDDAKQLLTKLGRSSTPSVANNPFGISLFELLGKDVSGKAEVVLIVDSYDSCAPQMLLDAGYCPILCSPGLLSEYSMQMKAAYFIVRTQAFRTGPWIGADTGAQEHLSSEIRQVARRFTETGRLSLLCPDEEFLKSPERESFVSSFGQLMTRVPEIDLEEQAKNTEIWKIFYDGNRSAES